VLAAELDVRLGDALLLVLDRSIELFQRGFLVGGHGLPHAMVKMLAE